MSDFLNQFSGEKYVRSSDREISIKKKKAPAMEPDDELLFSEVSDKSRGLSVKKQSDRVLIKGPEHDTVVDSTYRKRQLIRFAIVTAAALILLMTAFFAISLLNQVTVPDFRGMTLDDAKTWGITNRISIETESEFSIEYDESIVTAQAGQPHSKLSRGSVLKLTVSKGADPDEKLVLPDFASITMSELSEWKDANRAVNMSINQEYSDTVANGRFIRLQFINSSVSKANYTRKDSLSVYMSKGAEVFSEEIDVPDFTGRMKGEAEAFVKTNELDATYTEEASDTLPVGAVVAQDVKSGTRIAKRSKITFTISLGKSVIVPDFNDIAKEDAVSYEGMTVTVRSEYSSKKAYGRVLSQSAAAGTELFGDSPRVTVVYSEGLPYIDNLVGMSEKELPAYFYSFRSKDADITYDVTYIDSAADKGEVVWMSVYSEFVSLSTHVDVYVSKGNLPPPDSGVQSKPETEN